MKYIKNNPLILTGVFSIILITYFYSFAFNNPSQLFFSEDGGDGTKEYFTSIYHVKYDSTYFLSSSMNYPYGEELKFFGIQSLPINIIKFIHVQTGFLNELSVVTYINLSIILSLLISAIFIHLILKKLDLPWWIIVLFATPIAFLSPQLDRIYGHYPLAINCFIPISIYLLMLFDERKTILISILIGFFNLYVYEIHGYFFFMTASLSALYFIYVLLIQRSKILSNSGHLFLQVLLPFATIVILDVFSSNIMDRTNYPWGHMFYLSSPESVFLPISRAYFHEIALKIFGSINYLSTEGRAFVGYLALLVIILILARVIVKKDTRPFKAPTKNTAFNVAMVASLVILLFSFGFPFILELQCLVQYSGPVKQLRALGRFSWPFYYTINIFAVYYIYNYVKPRIGYALIACVFIILLFEVNYTNEKKEKHLNNHWSAYTSKDSTNAIYLISKAIQSDTYAAILPVPFFSIGSENINIDVRCNSAYNSFALSLRTGLPLISTMSSRLSFQQAYEMQKIALPPYRENNFWKKITEKSDKNILVFVTDCKLLSEGEKAIIKFSEKIIQQDGFTIYSFNPASAKKITESIYREKLKSVDTTTIVEPKLRNLQNGYYYNNFNTLNNFGYLSQGSSETKISRKSCIDTIIIPKNVKGNYIISLWFSDIYLDVLPRSHLLVNRITESNKEEEIISNELSKSVRIIDGHWALFEDTIYIPEGTKEIVLWTVNKEISKGVISIDDILIRRTDQTVLFRDPKGIIINNRKYLK